MESCFTTAEIFLCSSTVFCIFGFTNKALVVSLEEEHFIRDTAPDDAGGDITETAVGGGAGISGIGSI